MSPERISEQTQLFSLPDVATPSIDDTVLCKKDVEFSERFRGLVSAELLLDGKNLEPELAQAHDFEESHIAMGDLFDTRYHGLNTECDLPRAAWAILEIAELAEAAGEIDHATEAYRLYSDYAAYYGIRVGLRYTSPLSPRPNPIPESERYVSGSEQEWNERCERFIPIDLDVVHATAPLVGARSREAVELANLLDEVVASNGDEASVHLRHFVAAQRRGKPESAAKALFRLARMYEKAREHNAAMLTLVTGLYPYAETCCPNFIDASVEKFTRDVQIQLNLEAYAAC